jgi:hypothetical protein
MIRYPCATVGSGRNASKYARVSSLIADTYDQGVGGLVAVDAWSGFPFSGAGPRPLPGHAFSSVASDDCPGALPWRCDHLRARISAPLGLPVCAPWGTPIRTSWGSYSGLAYLVVVQDVSVG